MINLSREQIDAVNRLDSSKILRGGTGSGKSLTALAFYKKKYLNKKLYIITTPKKRNDGDWYDEMAKILLEKNREDIIVDSWNNIAKYIDVYNCFFIFDEQRAINYGLWGKSFIKICRKNKWILLTATPGDNWMDYMPVFIAAGYYKNKTDFITQHVIYAPYRNYPKIDRYVDVERLITIRNNLIVDLACERNTVRHEFQKKVDFDRKLYSITIDNLWNPYTNLPIKTDAELMSVIRKIVYDNESRDEIIYNIYKEYKKIIVFYNYNYELDNLIKMCNDKKITFAEYNGHVHQEIPDTDSWIYLVQYSAGAEAWNCIKTNAIVFRSMNPSYKIMEQAKGRIDRRNTPFTDLYYYTIFSDSSIDASVKRCLKKKTLFNEQAFVKMLKN